MLTDLEMQDIKEKADAYAGVKTPLRIKDYGAATKRVSAAYKDGAIEALTSERQKVKGLLDILNDCKEYFDDKADVMDGGEQYPNKEIRMSLKIEQALTNYNNKH